MLDACRYFPEFESDKNSSFRERRRPRNLGVCEERERVLSYTRLRFCRHGGVIRSAAKSDSGLAPIFQTGDSAIEGVIDWLMIASNTAGV
jgi:hypothetical protein